MSYLRTENQADQETHRAVLAGQNRSDDQGDDMPAAQRTNHPVTASPQTRSDLELDLDRLFSEQQVIIDRQRLDELARAQTQAQFD